MARVGETQKLNRRSQHTGSAADRKGRKSRHRRVGATKGALIGALRDGRLRRALAPCGFQRDLSCGYAMDVNRTEEKKSDSEIGDFVKGLTCVMFPTAVPRVVSCHIIPCLSSPACVPHRSAVCREVDAWHVDPPPACVLCCPPVCQTDLRAPL